VGIHGTAWNENAGVRGDSANHAGVWGNGETGVLGTSGTTAVHGQTTGGVGVLGQSSGGAAIHGFSTSGRGVVAQSATGAALRLLSQATPTDPGNGDIYLDNSGNLNVFAGGVWRRLQYAP
jgi:hypothetical protein